jgi:hypothetical protein
MKKIRKVNGASGFAADYLYDAGMRVAEGVYGDAAEKIEIFFSIGIEYVSAATVSHDQGRTLVGGQKELLSVEKPRVRFGRSR